jgi:hypothetical protein
LENSSALNEVKVVKLLLHPYYMGHYETKPGREKTTQAGTERLPRAYDG